MTILVFSLAILLTSFFAGIVGSLTGMGGAVILTPILVLLLNVDMYSAMGSSLISVIAISSSTAIAYLRDGYTNLRIGIFLETAAVVGAIFGSLMVAHMDKNILGILLGLVLIYSTTISLLDKYRSHNKKSLPKPLDGVSTLFKLGDSYPDNGKKTFYNVDRPIVSWIVMNIAGLLSGLLGIGGGALKVLVMDVLMRLPYKVSVTTSNFMIGITAAVSAGTYFANGYINPTLVFPVIIGVMLGGFVGAKLLIKMNISTLRQFFSIVIYIVALRLIYSGITGSL